MSHCPTEEQSSIRARADAIQLLRREYDEFVKRANVKMQLMENGIEKRKTEFDVLMTEHAKLVAEHEKTKGYVCELTCLTQGLASKLNKLTESFSEMASQKFDLASKISDARKRLDEAQKT